MEHGLDTKRFLSWYVYSPTPSHRAEAGNSNIFPSTAGCCTYNKSPTVGEREGVPRVGRPITLAGGCFGPLGVRSPAAPAAATPSGFGALAGAAGYGFGGSKKSQSAEASAQCSISKTFLCVEWCGASNSGEKTMEAAIHQPSYCWYEGRANLARVTNCFLVAKRITQCNIFAVFFCAEREFCWCEIVHPAAAAS